MVWAYGLGWIMSNRIDHAQLSLTIVSPTNIGGPEKLTTKDYMYISLITMNGFAF